MKCAWFVVAIMSKKGKQVYALKTRKKEKILATVNKHYKQGNHIYFKVVYGNGLKADGTYINKQYFLSAYQLFTEQINDNL